MPLPNPTNVAFRLDARLTKKLHIFKTSQSLDLRSAIGKVVAAFSLVFVISACCVPVTANRIQPFTDEWFDRQYDWVIYMGLNRMQKFMKYPGSTMTPIVRVPIEYRYAPNRPLHKNYPLDKIKYEELWYHDGKAVGCKRYTPLNLSSQEQGAIYIKPNEKNDESVRELTNAVVRLVLDAYAQKTILAAIIVPKDQFESFASTLTQYNFFKLTMVYPGGPGNNMSIHLTSEPYGIERYFYYDDTGRR